MSVNYSQFPVSGYDRADGEGGRPGTPTPDNQPQFRTASGLPYYFEELENSPTIERGEQTTITHKFKCDQITGSTYLQGLQRGQLMTDSQGNQTKILTSSLEYNKGDYWVLTVTAEGFAGFFSTDGVSPLDVPPDEFSVETLEFNPSIFLHPRYATVLAYDDPEQNTTGAQIFQWISAALNMAQVSGQTSNASLINSTRITDFDVLTLAEELLGKVRQGIQTFYLAGFKVVYSRYFFYPEPINPGGYIEDPVASGNLPYYFWSLDGTSNPDDGNNSLTLLAQATAPAFYEDGLSWLRQADTVQYQRTWVKITSIWIAGPNGRWDADLYNPQPPETPGG